MWWNGQNLDIRRKDKSGSEWSFRVWHCDRAQRIFFWDDAKGESGVVLLLKGKTLHVSKIYQLIDKLTADPGLRKRHARELNFPLNRHYLEYGAFPEEV